MEKRPKKDCVPPHGSRSTGPGPASEARKQTEHQPLASRPNTAIMPRPDTIITAGLFALGPRAQVEIARTGAANAAALDSIGQSRDFSASRAVSLPRIRRVKQSNFFG
jgi:hypothetical protein